MGRKKIVIKRLAEDRNRNVTFLKRKAGLMKKAWELSVLCGAEVSVIVFNSAGKLFEFSSVESVEKAIDRYHAYSGPVERRKPEEFAAQQAAGGVENSDDEDEVPAASGSGTNSGGAPITASGNMSLRGRDEWKEVTVPAYAHIPSPVENGDQLQRMSALDNAKPDIGPVDPRLYDRPSVGLSASSFHPDHDPSFSSYRMNTRESEEIMEQQRRAEQYRYLQMQAQMGNSVPPYTAHGGGHGAHLNGIAPSGTPSWMGMGRNRQRSDVGEGLDSLREDQLTSWAALRDARTSSAASLHATGSSQPAMNALYSQRLSVHHAQGLASPSAGSMTANGNPDIASNGISPASRHGLPAENVSAGDFAESSLNPGLDFYTPYHLPTSQGMNPDGTLDWQRTAAAAQLQAALQTQQAQLAYLRQQKAQQLHWKELVAASGMDYAVNQLGSRMANQSNHEGSAFEQGQYTPQERNPFPPSMPTDSASGTSSAPPTSGFSWPANGDGGAQMGSWYNNLNQQPSSLRTNVRVPSGSSSTGAEGRVSEGAARDQSTSAAHANSHWNALGGTDPASHEPQNMRNEGSSVGGSQEDLKPSEVQHERKRQISGDVSENEQESKRSKVE